MRPSSSPAGSPKLFGCALVAAPMSTGIIVSTMSAPTATQLRVRPRSLSRATRRASTGRRSARRPNHDSTGPTISTVPPSMVRTASATSGRSEVLDEFASWKLSNSVIAEPNARRTPARHSVGTPGRRLGIRPPSSAAGGLDATVCAGHHAASRAAPSPMTAGTATSRKPSSTTPQVQPSAKGAS